jgi:hypothetical protein
MSTDEPDVLTRSARPPDRTVVTGPEQTDVYDVWEPPADRAPRGLTVALVHGGFWREQYDRHHLPPLAAALAADGFHVANLEYPRIGMPGGGWPGTGTSVSDRVESALADDQLPHRRRPPRPLAGIGGATAGGSGRRGRVGAGGLPGRGASASPEP